MMRLKVRTGRDSIQLRLKCGNAGSDQEFFRYNIRYIHDLDGGVKKWFFHPSCAGYFAANFAKPAPVINGEHRYLTKFVIIYRYHMVITKVSWKGLPMQDSDGCDNNRTSVIF